MSEILDKLLADIKSAMKSGEKEKLTCLRGIHSEIKNVSINQKVDITDEIAMDALSKGVKQRKDAITQFESGGRTDLVEKNNQEIAWIQAYLPEQLSEEELASIVEAVIAETGASSRKDMGKVMQGVLAQAKGRADGKAVSALVGQKLAG